MRNECRIELLQLCACPRQLLAIEVDADEAAFRSDAAQQLRRVPRPAERAIHGHLLRQRLEHAKHFVNQNRPMLAGSSGTWSFHALLNRRFALRQTSMCMQ